LSTAENSAFLSFWGAFFAMCGALGGITSETTRAVFAGGTTGTTGTTGLGPRVVPVAGGFALVLVALVAVTAPLWSGAVFGASRGPLAGAYLLGALLFPIHSGLGGALSGRAQWSSYATLVGSEATMRLLLVAIVALATPSEVGFAVATTAATGTWILLSLVMPRLRAGWAARADVATPAYVARILAACSAGAATAILVVGFPVLVRLTSSDAVYANAAPIILAVSLTRAPLLVPLGAYQNVAVTKVMAGGPRAIRGVAALVVASTPVAAVAAYLLGPAVLRLIQPSYAVSAATFAALMIAAGLVALLTLSGAIALARTRHTLYSLGWIVATAVAIGGLLLPLDLDARVVASLIAGPLAGMAVHLLAIGQPTANPPQLDPEIKDRP